MDILSIIPTYLSSHEDRFNTTFVCRHWRRSFLENGALWSQLLLRKGEVYAEALLERAKGSPLDVIVDRDIPVNKLIALLSPHVQQIRYLEIAHSSWSEIIKFSENNFGQLPLLRTLKITFTKKYSRFGDLLGPIIPPSNSFFSNAANLEHFIFSSERFQLLSYFLFPRLTTLTLDMPSPFDSNGQDLFNFLKASPMLRTVEMRIQGNINLPEGPQEPIVILPNIETFSLHMICGWSVYRTAAHISCPYSKCTLLTYEISDHEVSPGLATFPSPLTSNAIICHYASSPVEEVIFGVEPVIDLWVGPAVDPVIGCSLTFRFSDTGVIKFGLRVTGLCVPQAPLEEICCDAFSQASTIIRAHPLLCHVKHLHIRYQIDTPPAHQLVFMAEEVGRLFGSVGPLDGLTIYGCDLHMFLASFFGMGDLLQQPIVFPSIKELTISYPTMEVNERECMKAIVELAKSQHEKGIPFEHVTIHAVTLPTAMAEALGRWVGAVNCFEDSTMKYR